MTDTVGALLVRNGLILLGRRAAHKSFADCWDIIGGHIEIGETPWGALCRELTEELGITDVEGGHLKSIDLLDSTNRASLLHVYVVTCWQGEPRMTDDEHIDLRWFIVADAKQIPNLVTAQYLPIFCVVWVGAAAKPRRQSARSRRCPGSTSRTRISFR